MQNINVNIVPDSYPQTIRYSQGDVGREFTINVTGFTIPTGATVKIQATKPSGFGFSVAGTVAGNAVTFTTTAVMTDEAGRFPAELKITKDSVVIGTANFIMWGEVNPHPEGTTDGQQGTIIPELTLLVERVEAAASSVLDMQVVAETLAAGSQASYSYDEDTNTATFGIPQGEAGAGAAGVVASAYSSSKTYKVGDYVLHNSNLYRCTTAITTAEAFTAAHWTQIVLANDVTDLKTDLQEAIDEFAVPTQEAVDNWLEAHPEATTTVEDHSLTYEKLVNGTLGFVTPQMYGAKGDGVADDTQSLQNCFANNRFIFIPDGVYNVSGIWTQDASIKPLSNSHIILSNNATIKIIPTSSSTYVGIDIREVDNVIVEGGKIVGDWDDHTGATGEYGHGIQILYSSNITIRNIDISKCWGDCVYVGTYTNDANKSSNVKIFNCVLHDSRRQGVSVCGCDYFTCEDTEIFNINGTEPKAGIDFEPNTNDIDGTTTHANTKCIVRGCYIHDTVGASIQCYNSTELTLEKNIIETFWNRKNYQNVTILNTEITTLNIGSEAIVRVYNCVTKARTYLLGSISGLGKCYFINTKLTAIDEKFTDGDYIKTLEIYIWDCDLQTTLEDETLGYSDNMLLRARPKYLELVGCKIRTAHKRGLGRLYGVNGVLIDRCNFKSLADEYTSGSAIFYDLHSDNSNIIIKNSTFDVSLTRMKNSGSWVSDSPVLFYNNYFKGSSAYMFRPTSAQSTIIICFVRNVLPIAEADILTDATNINLVKQENIYSFSDGLTSNAN